MTMTQLMPKGRPTFPSLPRLNTTITTDSAARLRRFQREMNATLPSNLRNKQS